MKVFDNILVQASLVPATRTADANGTGIDTKGFNDAMLVVAVGDIDLADANETYEVILEESDDNSTFTEVTDFSITITADNQVKGIAHSDLNLTASDTCVRCLMLVELHLQSLEQLCLFLAHRSVALLEMLNCFSFAPSWGQG